jgi:hypothetical protein
MADLGSEASAAAKAQEARLRRLRYSDTLPPLTDEARKLMEDYSKIPPDQVEKHVKKVVCILNLE